MGKHLRPWLAAVMLGVSSATGATSNSEDKPMYDRISFTVSAGTEVANDTLTAILYARREGPNLSELSNEVNQLVAAALTRARQESAVKVQTLDYQTHPSYQNNKVSGWEVRQAIRLESKAAEPLAKLIGELQSSLALASVDYSVSPEQAKEIEEKLIDQALAQFRSRADRITKDLGRTRYRIVSLQVNTGGQPVFRPKLRMVPMAAEAAPMAGAPPMLEPGSDRVEVEVNGTIELQPN